MFVWLFWIRGLGITLMGDWLVLVFKQVGKAHPKMGISSMAQLGSNQNVMCWCWSKQFFFSAQRTNPLTTRLFHSPTAPAPLSSISFPSPLSFYPRIIFIHQSSSLHTRSFRTIQVPSHVRISHPIIPTLHHHDTISDSLFHFNPFPSILPNISPSVEHGISKKNTLILISHHNY